MLQCKHIEIEGPNGSMVRDPVYGPLSGASFSILGETRSHSRALRAGLMATQGAENSGEAQDDNLQRKRPRADTTDSALEPVRRKQSMAPPTCVSSFSFLVSEHHFEHSKASS